MPTDVVPPAVRSRMMAGIKGKNTKPELLLRSKLHRRGFRFRLHRRDLPGRPDLVFPKRDAVIFVHGCFWHGHDCHLFRLPKSRTEFWGEKIAGNAARDRHQMNALRKAGWRVGVVWECALKGRTRLPLDEVMDQCAGWLISDEPEVEIHGD
jgi:DNA mismatch endonuclease (patch repair protein)